MSILIKGIKMPTNCKECPFYWEQCGVDPGAVEEGYRTERKRHPDCPLVPVPDHGGLVDLKAPFCAQYYDEMTEEWVEKEVTVEDVLLGSMVCDMPPVVIPADKEEET